MTTATKSKLKKNDNLTIWTHPWSDYENGRRHRLNRLETVSGYEYHLEDGAWVFVHRQPSSGWWVVSDYCTGMKVSDVCKTRKDAMESAERNAKRYAEARETDRYKDACQMFLILAVEGDLSDDELKEKIEDWHREIREREDEDRENAHKIARTMATVYQVIYDAYDKVEDYGDYVDYGLKWASDHPERMRLINEARAIPLDDGSELPNPVMFDREFASLAYTVKGENPVLIQVPEPTPSDSEPVDPDGIEKIRSIFAGRDVSITQKREGCCIWASGDTEPCKEQLKELGFRWSPKRRAWYLKAS